MMIEGLIISLLLTLLIECVFGLYWGLRGRDLYLLFLVNLLTNPVVVLSHALTDALLLPELAAVAVEGALYSRLGENIDSPWLFSLRVNAFSFVAGLLIQYVF